MIEIWQNVGMGQSETLCLAFDKYSAMSIIDAMTKERASRRKISIIDKVKYYILGRYRSIRNAHQIRKWKKKFPDGEII